MSTVIIHATPFSTYGRTCTMALIDKGVPYELDPAGPQTPEQLARQPWGAVPAMSHGDVRLYETLAIASYIDTAFDGPALQPDDALQRAQMNQWISVFIQYLYRPAIDIALQRLFVPAQGGTANEELIAESVPKTEKALAALDGALDGQNFFAGSIVSLADYFVFPLLPYLDMTPEGPALFAETPNLTRWQSAMAKRDSAQKTPPPSL